MEENFETLLDMYMDDDEISKKINLDNEEIKREKKDDDKEFDTKKDITKYREYAISMEEYLSKYLRMDTSKISAKTLTHKNLKSLTIDNPLVIGIYNGYVDIDEIKRRDYLIVIDVLGNIGSYLNPDRLRDLTKLEIVANQLRILKRSSIYALQDLAEFYAKFMQTKKEFDYLNLECSKYYEMLTKSEKNDSVRKIKKYVKKYGNESLDIILENNSN